MNNNNNNFNKNMIAKITNVINPENKIILIYDLIDGFGNISTSDNVFHLSQRGEAYFSSLFREFIERDYTNQLYNLQSLINKTFLLTKNFSTDNYGNEKNYISSVVEINQLYNLLNLAEESGMYSIPEAYI